MWTPKTNLLTFAPKGVFRVTSGIIFSVCSTQWVFSMFSCIHFSNFLSDPIGKQSAMPKRDQETTSSEGSPMAKPKPMLPAKTKPVDLFLRSPWSARENPPQGLGFPVNPVNDDAGQGDHTSTRRLVRTPQPKSRTFSSEATGKCSKFRFLETV